MTKQYLVVEVVTARGTIENVFINVDADPAGVANGFRRLAEDGTKVTGAYSFIERIGEGFRRYTPERAPLWARDGFRRMAAWLR